MSAVLTLNLENHCQGGTCNCDDTGKFIAEKKTNAPAYGFIRVTHKDKSGRLFTLSGKLNNGDKIRGKGKSIGQPITDVTDVSVYYWNGAPNTPILLGITKNRKDKGEPTYYSYTNSSIIDGVSYNNFWSHAGNSGRPLLHLLDEKNCQRNRAVPFNIQDSTSGSILNNSNSTCIKDYRNITKSDSKLPPPPGSNYAVTAYDITGPSGKDTKISRVTLGDKLVTFSTPTEAVEKIRLYSYPGSDSVPLMFEFKLTTGASRWYYSTSKNGTNWSEVREGTQPFYSGNGPTSIPTDDLSEQLDEVLCKQHGNVTLNLTRRYSETHDISNQPYCCSDHKDKDARISVTKGDIIVNSLARTTSYYKHSISDGYDLAGIKFYHTADGWNRKNIKLHGSPFPISVNSVYAFYCKGEEPSLIYVDSDGMAKGWYKEGGGEWRWNSKLSVIKSTDLSNLSCAKWKRLKEVLRNCGCSSLNDCSDPEQAEEEKLQKEEERIKHEREKAQQKQQTSTASHGLLSGTEIAGNSNGTPGGSVSPSSGSRSSSPKGSPGSFPPVVSNSGTGGVTIQLDSRTSYPSSFNSLQLIDVTSYNLNHLLLKGYDAYDHTYSHGAKFTVKDFTVKGRGQTFIPPVIPVKDVKSVIVYSFTCGKKNTSLLVYIGDRNGDYHKWYENKGYGKWTDVSNELKGEPPEKAKNLDITLKTIKQALGISCEGKSRKLLIKGCDNNNLPGLEENRRQHNLGSSQGNLNAIPQLLAIDQKTPKTSLKNDNEIIDLSSEITDSDPHPEQKDNTISPVSHQQSNSPGPGTPGVGSGPGPASNSDVHSAELTEYPPFEVTKGPLDKPADTPTAAESTAKLAVPLPLVPLAGYITPSVFGGAGGLTGFAYWIYKRSKGDPWVRHGYPMKCLKHVPC